MYKKLFFFLAVFSSFTLIQAQTFSKTYSIKETGGSISFSITPMNVNITDGGNQYNKVIRYNINYNIKVTYKNIPYGATLRNTQIKFINSTRGATEGTSYVPPYTFNFTNQTYSEALSTSTNPYVRGYTIDDLSDKNISNNTQILQIANYNSANLKFVLQSPSGSEYDFDDYNKSNGDNLTIEPYSLPIKLISFSVSQNHSSNILNWNTATEINNEYFVVEKSRDGTLFDSIATVKGAGNSTVVSNYSYTDNEPYNGTNFYRLKQVDFDGISTTSKVINISSINFFPSNSINIYPNPGIGNITISGDWNNIQNVLVYNMAGVTVLSKAQNSNQLQLPSSLQSGIYFINFMYKNGTRKTIKYLLQK